MVGVHGVLAGTAAGAGSDLGGWYVGIAIGVLVVLIVAVVALLLIQVAARIRRQAGMAVAALEDARANTQPLWDVATTNRTAKGVLEGAIRAREAVEDL